MKNFMPNNEKHDLFERGNKLLNQWSNLTGGSQASGGAHKIELTKFDSESENF